MSHIFNLWTPFDHEYASFRPSSTISKKVDISFVNWLSNILRAIKSGSRSTLAEMGSDLRHGRTRFWLPEVKKRINTNNRPAPSGVVYDSQCEEALRSGDNSFTLTRGTYHLAYECSTCCAIECTMHTKTMIGGLNYARSNVNKIYLAWATCAWRIQIFNLRRLWVADTCHAMFSSRK